MNKILPLLLMILTGIVTMSLCPIDNRGLNSPRAGDVLTLYDVNYTDTISSGVNRMWDLSKCEISRRIRFSFASTGQDSIGCIVSRTRYLFSICGDTLYNRGFENNLSDISYNTSETLILGPVEYGRVFSGNFFGQGRYSDRMRHESNGEYTTTADAIGRFVTPDGDTIPEVTRLTTVRRTLNKYFLSTDNGCNTPSDSLNLQIRECRWYAKGYRYPLLITTDLYTGYDNRQLSHTARYMPISAFDEIDDPDNEEIRRLINIQSGTTNDIEELGKYSPTINYTLSQDKSAKTVTIHYNTSYPTDLEFILTDMRGIVYRTDHRHCHPEESGKITFEYGNLPYSAVYGVNINGGHEHYSEKFYR